MDPSNCEKMLRLKIASEIVLGNQASVAFSRAFYLEDLLIDKLLKELQELSEACQRILSRVQKFTDEVLTNDTIHPDLSPTLESSARCECSGMSKSLGTHHQPTLESFQQKLIQAKARRQAKSCLLERLSTQSNNNISAEFSSMTLDELLNNVNIPEFSCFINDSDFGVLEKLVADWDEYREAASKEFFASEKKLDEFYADLEKNRKMREYTCDMILAQITTPKHLHHEMYVSDTLKKNKGMMYKFSTLWRRKNQKDRDKSSPASFHGMSPSPELNSGLSIREDGDRHEQTF